jgi:hypothetical protein
MTAELPRVVSGFETVRFALGDALRIGEQFDRRDPYRSR